MPHSKIILVIDDDPDDIAFFCEALGEIDDTLHCLAANSGEEALNLLRTQTSTLPDYIFLDLNMPRLNGKQTLIELKADPRLSNVPVIIYTTSKSKDDMEDTKRLGAACYVTKPNKFSSLKKMITIVLDEKWELVNELNRSES